MGADEPDIDNPIRIVDPNNDAILVTGDIEDSAAVLENADSADIPLDVRRPRPVGLPDLPLPSHCRLTCISNAGATIEKSLDRAQCNSPIMGPRTLVMRRVWSCLNRSKSASARLAS
jgi:hypothetical protein